MSLINRFGLSGNDGGDSGQSLSIRETPGDEQLLYIDPLPEDHRRGLIAIVVLAFLSVIATASLLGFLTFRLIFWRRYYKRYMGYNQYIILIYNLLLADFQQAIGFFLSIVWVAKDSIHAPSATCFIQGWTLQIGDPASGMFVLTIAVHTFFMVFMGKRISHRMFVGCLVASWAFMALLVIIPTAKHGVTTYVPAGAWCWMSDKYPVERLWLHYFWIFLSEFGTVVLYIVMFYKLRQRLATSAALSPNQTESLRRLKRIVGYMIIYPIAYVVLSLPLAAGRMSSARGKTPDITYFCLAGAMMASSGLVDTILYTATRRALLSDSEASLTTEQRDRPSAGTSNKNRISTFITGERRQTRTNISGGITRWFADEESSTDSAGDGSTDGIIGSMEMPDIGKVYQKTTVEITHEPASLSDSESSPSGGVSDVPPAYRGSHTATGLWK
ncbi:hypothetical protein FQN54_006524 [Arachnomyces sp. PD_36]|nr:hypothetical protein FQN54_006524 [Arachnomyces sp. PD_36]